MKIWYIHDLFQSFKINLVTKITNLKMIFPQVDFPAVTICNQNRVNCTGLELLIEECEENVTTCINETYFEIIEDIFLLCNATDLQDPSEEEIYPGSGSGGSNQGPKGRKKRNVGPIPDEKDSDDFDEQGDIPEDAEAENEFLSRYMSLPESLRLKIGHQFPSFVKYCTFRSRNCLNER